jgi:2-polyprenyl-3-methyl-5-hydroxy-6-metoxy-1,4-benzoquinol methylase
VAQNIYDDTEFFDGYSQFPRSRDGLAAAAEWPSLRAMLPPLSGLRVLDLGCGFGYFAQWAAQAGASEVVGLDLSEKMLDVARRNCADLPVRFARADLETAALGNGAYDLVFSSLAVHYLADFDSFCARVRAALVPGGSLVFSMEHPVFAARAKPDFVTDSEGRMVGAVLDYLREGERVTNWIADGVVKHHRLISSTINSLIAAGFVLDHVEEWAATDADIVQHPEWEKERYQPMFLLFAAHLSAPTSA